MEAEDHSVRYCRNTLFENPQFEMQTYKLI